MKGEDSDLGFLKSIMPFPVIILPSSSTVRQAILINAYAQNKKTYSCY